MIFDEFFIDFGATSLPKPDKERTESMLESMLLSVIVVCLLSSPPKLENGTPKAPKSP